MTTWRDQLPFDPVSPLLASGDDAVVYFVRRDLLGEEAGPPGILWELPAARKLFRKQGPDGSWPRSGPTPHPAVNYPLIETWRTFRFLVEQFGFTREHPSARQAAEFLFSCQTQAGDIRGILANQYATYYTGAIMALLIQAGYADDPRIDSGFEWLLHMRQSDGGWSIPLITHRLDRQTQYRLTSEFAEPLEPDRAKPFSHNATGMILRAFAVHPQRRNSEPARVAAGLLASRFFQRDAYSSYRAASYWLRFDYPFWWNNLVAALDSVTRIGLTSAHPAVRQGVAWLVDHQQSDGLWPIQPDGAGKPARETAKSRQVRQWVALAICRVLVRLAPL